MPSFHLTIPNMIKRRLLHMHLVHLELQIQFPSLPQCVAVTVMDFMATSHGTYLLFPTTYFFFYVCLSVIQRNWNHLENVGFFSCIHHESSSLFYIYFYFCNIPRLLVYLKILAVSQPMNFRKWHRNAAEFLFALSLHSHRVDQSLEFMFLLAKFILCPQY